MTSLYPIVLHFHQVFTQGLLKGLEMNSRLGFCTLSDAVEWVDGVNDNNSVGRCDYTVTCYRVNEPLPE